MCCSRSSLPNRLPLSVFRLMLGSHTPCPLIPAHCSFSPSCRSFHGDEGLQALLASPDVDAVLVVLPPQAQGAVVQAALRAGESGRRAAVGPRVGRAAAPKRSNTGTHAPHPLPNVTPTLPPTPAALQASTCCLRSPSRPPWPRRSSCWLSTRACRRCVGRGRHLGGRRASTAAPARLCASPCLHFHPTCTAGAAVVCGRKLQVRQGRSAWSGAASPEAARGVQQAACTPPAAAPQRTHRPATPLPSQEHGCPAAPARPDCLWPAGRHRAPGHGCGPGWAAALRLPCALRRHAALVGGPALLARPPRHLCASLQP